MEEGLDLRHRNRGGLVDDEKLRLSEQRRVAGRNVLDRLPMLVEDIDAHHRLAQLRVGGFDDREVGVLLRAVARRLHVGSHEVQMTVPAGCAARRRRG